MEIETIQKKKKKKMDEDIVSASREILEKFIRELHELTTYVKMMNSLDVEAGKFGYQILSDACSWNEDMYDWYFDHGSTYITSFMDSNALNDFMYVEYSYKQLGKDEKWLQQQIRALNNDMAIVKRELLNEWTYASTDSVFDEETLDTISRFADKDYVSKIYLQNNKYVFYLTKMPTNIMDKNWIVSIDMGGGLSMDRTVITVIDPLDLQTVMLFKNNTITTSETVDLVKELIDVYLPNAVLIPERNYTGISFIDYMLKDGKYGKNMFYTTKMLAGEKQVEMSTSIFDNSSSRTKKRKTERRVYGVNTTKASRDRMINDILFMIVNDRPELVNNRDLFGELKTLVRKKNTGKIEHSNGAHDDVIMSYLIGLYAYFYEERSIKKFLKVISSNADFEKTEDEKKEASKVSSSIHNLSRTISGTEEGMLYELYKENKERRTLDDDAEDYLDKNRNSRASKINRFRNLF